MPDNINEQTSEHEIISIESSYISPAGPDQNLVKLLVANFKSANRKLPTQELQEMLQGRDLAKRDLALYTSWLAEAHSFFRDASHGELTLSFASEWVLDNYYIVRQALQQIKEDLPASFYNQLPKLTSGSYKGMPRIYAIARTILTWQQFLLNSIDLETILIRVQEQIPLTMGELWALPIFLRYTCIEVLAHELVRVIHPPRPPQLPVFFPQQEGILELKTAQSTANDQTIANIILSLRSISELDWNVFFEAVNRLEVILRQDPPGIYAQMDFKTRDHYRKEIETLALEAGLDESDLAQKLLDLAHNGNSTTIRPESHLGEYLLGKGRASLEEHIGFKPSTKTTFKRWCFRHASSLYLFGIFSAAILFLILLTAIIKLPVLVVSLTLLQRITLFGIGIVLLVPILTSAASIANWLVTINIHPNILPKMHFREEIPPEYQTLVVIPALITSQEEIASLALQLEMHYLRNPEPGILFALLTDYRDADSETQPEDEDLLNYAASAIKNLNEKYRRQSSSGVVPEGQQSFFLLHRNRLWNPSEGKWMGWERKRGKLHEMNLLIRGGENLSFSKVTYDMGGMDVLRTVHYVITLDADTVLPRGAARRLAGTLAHPLNQAHFNDKTGQVTSGYTILQPRMEIHPRSTNFSWFTRIFAGDTGLDLYTRAVSDAYQDLFGEGSYVGKGIYDVDDFERSVDQRIPENSVLSHDLLEGIMGRAGLVTDITMIEDYPQNYFVQMLRQRRWVRGDWQLLPWLLTPGRFHAVFSVIDRWKMLDNLLRSLLVPSLVLIFGGGMLFLPNLAGVWVAVVLVSLGIPLLTSLTRSTIQTLGGENIGAAFNPLGSSIIRWLLAVAFMPYEAYINLDAIFTTLHRLLITHKKLLQWTTAAQTSKLFGNPARRNSTWLKMAIAIVLSISLASAIQLLYQGSGGGVSPDLIQASPILLLWLFAPLVAQWISLPIKIKKVRVDPDQAIILRQVIRRTWGFFERFVGPEDHWLPPDHFQESPAGITAHHTSPSNIGLLLTSTLAAYDFGYLNQADLLTRLTTTMDTLDQMERFRGHFLNWYDTLTLQPLTPRYVSTVDSGNLAASFIIIEQACKQLPGETVFRWNLWQGYLDTLSNLSDTLSGMGKAGISQQVEDINHRIAQMHAKILAVRSEPEQWFTLFKVVSGQFWQDLSNRLMKLVEAGRTTFDLETLRKLQEVAAQVERLHLSVQRTMDELVPWIAMIERPPSLFEDEQFLAATKLLRANLPYNPLLERIRDHALSSQTNIVTLRQLLTEDQKHQNAVQKQEVMDWLDLLEQALSRASTNAALLVNGFAHISERSGQHVSEMDFRFLYHPLRRVFHIGFNLEAGQLDNNYYDLLASEARIASIIALAKGEVPQTHWLQLGRPMTRVEGMHVLLSWSATMFEYLMPPLFLRSFPGTLLAESAQGAVRHQIAYGKTRDVPWGISESGFYRFDPNQNYQYRAFGVPGLGFKRGLGDDLVIAPYASLMAIRYDPRAVAQNLAKLVEHNAFGVYGVYEAIDFTPERLAVGDTSIVVREYMSHHQGMIMMALVNFFHNDIMVKRMHSDPRIQSVELLLQEQVSQAVPLQNPYAEDVKGIRRLTAGPIEIAPWSVPVHTPIPQVNLLSNGTFHVILSNMGGGGSTWRGVDLTRWQADGVLDPWGTWVYIQEKDLESDVILENGKAWSACYLPLPGRTEDLQVTYFAHMAVFRRTENGITSTMEITVPPEDPVEIRQIHLHNTTSSIRRLRLTSYGEVILAPQASDTRHPAFNKLFIESEFVDDLNLQIFKRRPRSSQEKPTYMGHMLVVKSAGGLSGSQLVARHEADRSRFIGRGRTWRNPAALSSDTYLSGSSGATLDPIFALGIDIEINPLESSEMAYLTFAGEDREAILALAHRYRSWELIKRSFHQANISTLAWLGKEHFDTEVFKTTLQVLSALLYPFKEMRTQPAIIAANRLSQSGLWRFGISGDYPILLVELEDPKQIDLAREVLQVHEFLRSRKMMVDVVILNHQQTDYGAELNGMLYRLVARSNSEQWLNQRGGIFVLFADQMKPDELTLLRTAGRVVVNGGIGTLSEHMPIYPLQVHHLPDFIPSYPNDGNPVPEQNEPLPILSARQFFNGYGGFSPDGREYIIDSEPGRSTPAPWINVIGYPHFGFMVSEAGSQSTWAINSGENRLTPWSNDPVSDPTGEALYLRDEETGQVWTPTPLPANSGLPYRTTHGAGYTLFEHHSHGLRQSLTLFASPEDPVKIIHLKVENTLNHPRRITATQYVEWVLGTTHAGGMQYIVPEYDATEACLMASNPYSAEFGERTAFLIASLPIHGLTADRAEFLGRGGSPAFPAALRRIGLETRITPGEDPCAVLQVHLDLQPGAKEEIYFVLGQGINREQALALARKYHNPTYVGAALERTHAFWSRLLDTIQVHTPQPAVDIILNRWMLYQSLSCRIWGRSAFYQPSGAYGFRDQLQDVLALLPIDPGITRGQILNAAQHQFEEGDVMHWWHPPSGRGVRTRISDDLLWLPYVTALYVEATGDNEFLQEKIHFLKAPMLNAGENERYNQFPESPEGLPLIEHCKRAIARGATQGVNGLPLIGTGDWNDGLNRVGEGGKGESVWLGWFLIDVLDRFASLCSQNNDVESSTRYQALALEYRAAIEKSAWDGKWYRRATYDDGTWLGSSQDEECQIDAIAQSWSVLSGAGAPDHSRQAMQSVIERLVQPQNRISLLFTPPFDNLERDPGYIKGYLPGIRENGGQYSHAATWTAWAFARLGDGKQAGELFDLLNPIFLSDTPEKADRYCVEPYVICADIYSRPPLVGRGGWTWYTGSAAWMYRLGLEAILGFQKIGNGLRIKPVIPPDWDGFEIRYKFGLSVYFVQVLNPDHITNQVRQIMLDGQPVEGESIPLIDDQMEHKIVVTMG